ncbi:MAG: hypothetical protein WCH84_11360 [Verrucomicrobiota bacterium]
MKKPNRLIVFIALAAIAIVAGWSACEEQRSPCASGACRLPLLPANNTWTNATLQPATNIPSGNPQE